MTPFTQRGRQEARPAGGRYYSPGRDAYQTGVTGKSFSRADPEQASMSHINDVAHQCVQLWNRTS
jgi:hypothetical protein